METILKSLVMLFIQNVYINDHSMCLEQKLYHCLDWRTITPCLKFKRRVYYIYASLFCLFKEEHLWNKKCFSFTCESSFRSSDNQILTFHKFKCYDVIKCPGMKHKPKSGNEIYVILRKKNFLSKTSKKNVARELVPL